MANDPGRERLISSILLGAAGLVTIIVLLIHSMNASGVSRFPEAGGGKASEASFGLPAIDHAAEAPYRYYGAGSILLLEPNKEEPAPVLVRFGKRTYGSAPKDNGWYVDFSYYRENKEIASRKILSDSVASVDCSFRLFNNNKLYFILDDQRMFRVNPDMTGVTEITHSVFSKQARLKGNVCNLGFVDKVYGDGLELRMKTGKILYYYPLDNKIYTQQQLDTAAAAHKTIGVLKTS